MGNRNSIGNGDGNCTGIGDSNGSSDDCGYSNCINTGNGRVMKAVTIGVVVTRVATVMYS